VTKRLNILISEGIAVGRGAYLDGKRVGTVTSSINSPNVSLEQRLAIGSKRQKCERREWKCRDSFVWLYDNLFETDEEGKDITTKDDKPIRIALELFREDKDGNPSGRPVLGYITQEGINEATAHKALRHIETYNNPALSQLFRSMRRLR